MDILNALVAESALVERGGHGAVRDGLELVAGLASIQLGIMDSTRCSGVIQ